MARSRARAPNPKPHRIEAPYYPIVYVRGYAMQSSEREETFYDTYYGFAANSVEKRQAPPPQYFEADVFEGQLIRLMKLKDYAYADAANRGEAIHGNPSRSLWICRFYDKDYLREKLRNIEEHAEDLRVLVCETIPARLESCGVDLGPDRSLYKVNLIAHSMGGLVCRSLIQTAMVPMREQGDPRPAENPRRWIHRLVTLGTPHRGIELGRIPDFLENFIASHLNPFDVNIFKEERMRKYLGLSDEYDVHSLGDAASAHHFPAKRCLCVIGSDYHSYFAAREATGNFSDGLVKQDRAYVVEGKRDPGAREYPLAQQSFYANVHRAHSGRRGIVNSYESFENIQRFLFGNIMAEISLEGIEVNTPDDGQSEYFYDFEFYFSIRNSGCYLHRREQDPCENAIRIERKKLVERIHLHTAFMNSKLKDVDLFPARDDEDDRRFSHFSAKLRVVEHRVKRGYLWDRDYPEKPIYNETIEVRVGDADPAQPGDELQFRWLSDTGDWSEAVEPDGDGVYRIPLRGQGALRGNVAIQAGIWPDPRLTRDGE